MTDLRLRIIFALALLLASLLAIHTASAQNQTTFRDSRGSTIGTATRSGNTVTFRDARGSTTGTATRVGKQTIYRNSRGSTTGYSTGTRR